MQFSHLDPIRTLVRKSPPLEVFLLMGFVMSTILIVPILIIEGVWAIAHEALARAGLIRHFVPSVPILIAIVLTVYYAGMTRVFEGLGEWWHT